MVPDKYGSFYLICENILKTLRGAGAFVLEDVYKRQVYYLYPTKTVGFNNKMILKMLGEFL